MLLTAFRNLLSNAIKFTPSGGSVVVTVLNESSVWRIDFWDTGVGISLEDISGLFRLDTEQ